MQSKNVIVFVQATQIVCYVFPILATMNPFVLMYVQELVLVNGFEQEWVNVRYFVMEETETCNIHVQIKVRNCFYFFRLKIYTALLYYQI